MKLPLAALILLTVAAPAFAHRLDEYLQAALITVTKDHVAVELHLTPGVQVFHTVLAEIDADSNGILSEAEQRAYVQRVLRDLSLSVDGHPLQLRVVSSVFPKIEDMKEGMGDIVLELDARVPAVGSTRRLIFENRHQRTIAAYLVNCLSPDDPEIRITGQNRNYEQSVYQLDYTQPSAHPIPPPRATWLTLRLWLGINAIVLFIWLASRLRRQHAGVTRYSAAIVFAIALCCGPVQSQAAEEGFSWEKLAPYFTPPPEFASKMGAYRSPLLFDDGTKVTTPADWARRRQEIIADWQRIMGAWPPLIERPKVEYLQTERREDFVQHNVRVEIARGLTDDGYLLAPKGSGPFPAIFVPFYEPETSTGLAGKPLRDFALQLTRRGFVTLSIGSPGGDARKPDLAGLKLQPLSFLGYVGANCYNALAALPYVDPKRIGIVGHSYGGKWAMFAGCFYDKYAAAVWSDPGIVWDEARANVNYWEPWYLGLDSNLTREPGLISPDNPRTGAYKVLVEGGHDLVEVHALMAPRPFLVSGGAEDQPSRWIALNHAVQVNKLLGYENRVGLTSRATHDPTPQSNEVIYAFFEHFLMDK